MAEIYGLIFLINIIPAFMPPTWLVIAFFYIHNYLPLPPLVVGGAVISTGGRYALARASGWLGPKILSRERQASLRHLGNWLNARAAVGTPIAVLAFSLGPIPSNNVFISADLAGARLGPMCLAFGLGRVVSYYLLPLGTRAVAGQLSELFSIGNGGLGGIILEILSLALLVVLARIDRPGLPHFPGAESAPPTTADRKRRED